ncbi:hypothetical protein [Sphingomonas sp. Leaf21]|uniref:hypothetical protein n=1 Tax=Sphingomonas sp. Leaf21 TaxID=2876550 RepID=UPI001E446B32|nr:hypothetical protein [Sphingomonas sp. Leaf21]
MIRGWTAVIVFTTLAVVMMVGVNVRMWRRMKAATAVAKADGDGRKADDADTAERDPALPSV